MHPNIPKYSFYNDNTFEIVENNWMENQEEEDEDKREKKENKKIEYQITLQNKSYFSGNSNTDQKSHAYVKCFYHI